MICQNSNFRSIEKVVVIEGRSEKVIVPEPCPLYSGEDLQNPKNVVDVITVITD